MDNMQLTTSDCDDAPESPGAPSSQLPGSSLPGRGACEACRTRKIRCDRDSPCLQCRRADIECVHPVSKRKEKRTRILLTPQYERKIDLIDHRLEDLTRLLHDLKTHIPAPGNGNSSSSANSNANSNANGSQHEISRPLAAVSPVTFSSSPSFPSDSARPAVVEGDSSLSAHSVFVNDFLQNFIEPGHAQNPDSEISRTLDALSHVVTASREQPRIRESQLPNARPQRPTNATRYTMPPIQKAVALIQAAKARHLAGTGWVYEYMTMQSFGDLCLQAYFSDDISPYDFISVNAGLYSLFSDYASVTSMSQDEKDQFLAYAHLCRDNLETGLADVPLHLPASANVIAALLFGAFYCIQTSACSLCWSLSSKASELCQTLGYHRSMPRSSQGSESSRYEQFLFWTTYYVDKSYSLRLGRPSTIADWDITISLPSVSSTDQEPVLAFFVTWIKVARCQGNIYEMLYSPAAMGQPDHVRQSRVDFLASTLRNIEDELERTKAKWLQIAKEKSGDDLMDFYAISDDILRLSLLTHIYRAAPRAAGSSTTFNLDCVKVARATLNKHHECMAVVQRTNNIHFSTYIHWTLLFAPFIPFIVIFCHVMETRDKTDLTRLGAFVNSIQAATTVSEAAAKMHRLFQVLYNIATRYMELRIQHDGRTSSVPPVPAMDTQLADLGFPYAGLWEANYSTHIQHADLAGGDTLNTPPGSYYIRQPLDQMLWMGNSALLEDWLYNNQASIELLQDTK